MRDHRLHVFVRLFVLASVLLGSREVLARAPDEVGALAPCTDAGECLAWTATQGATRYHLYRGELQDLPALLDASLDVCERGVFTAASTGPSVPDSPAPGGLFWYVVTAEDASGEGGVGSGSYGLRIANSRGPCTLACDAGYAPQPNIGAAEAPGLLGCPAGMTRVDTFCIDVYEASLVRQADGSPWSPYVNPGPTSVMAQSRAGMIPQAYISGSQAAVACTNAGKRLCTDAEWLRACRGPSTFTYPYGNARVAQDCNDSRATNPAADYYGSDPWNLTNRCLDQLGDTLDPTGANAACMTAEGIYDMVGNVAEWTSDPNGTFRGGTYLDAVLNGPGCLDVTTAHAFAYWDMVTGFRCCFTP